MWVKATVRIQHNWHVGLPNAGVKEQLRMEQLKNESWGESWASLQSDRLHPQGTQMRVLGSPDTPRLGLNNAAGLVVSVNTRPALATHQMLCLTAWPRRWLVLVNVPCRPERMCLMQLENWRSFIICCSSVNMLAVLKVHTQADSFLCIPISYHRKEAFGSLQPGLQICLSRLSLLRLCFLWVGTVLFGAKAFRTVMSP